MNVIPQDGSVLVKLEREEADLLRSLLHEMRGLMREDAVPDDPVLTRLMPAAYEDAAEQARYAEVLGDSLRSAKLDAIDVVERGIGDKGGAEALVTDDQAPAWLSVLTDIRLAIATRVGVTQEMMDAQPESSDPNAAALSVVHWLGWLQDSMIGSISPD